MNFHTGRILISLLVLLALASLTFGQGETAEQTKIRARALVDAQKYTEALPLYEQLAKQLPTDIEVHRNLGFALLGQALNTEDPASKRQLRIRARNAFIKARDFGDNSQFALGMIEGIPADGSDTGGYSDNAEANRLMQKAEAYFASGKLDDALKTYAEALAVDPRCYFAALFSGDVHLKGNRFDEAERWYQKAIAIDPYTETAYRYSATPLMRSGKYDQARDRYIEAYIVSPYSRMAISGISQWGEVTKTSLHHPKIDVPQATTGADGKQNTTINVNPLADDGSMAWVAYSATREIWRKEKFAKTYPGETGYRHSLAEEADALRSVVSMAKTLKPKSLNPQIDLIDKMDKDGVLEAFILLALADEGIAREHASYLRQNREKLRKYVVGYVIQKK